MTRALALAVVAFWLALIGWVTQGFSSFTTYSAALAEAGPIPRPAPDFGFTDQAGVAHRLRGFRGGWVLVNFLYLDCPTACPITTNKLSQVHEALEASMPGTVEFLSIDFEDDPRDRAREMWLAHGAPKHWSIGVISPGTASSTLRDYGVYVYRRPDGLINHGVYLFLIDPAGALRRAYTPEPGPAALARLITEEIQGKGREP